MNEILTQIGDAIALHAPRILAALAILLVGWLIATTVGAAMRGLMRRTGLGDRLAGWLKLKDVDLSRGIGKGVFYLLMLFVLVAVFQTLGLTLITEPLNELLGEVTGYLPNILGGAALLVLALVLANVVKMLLSKLLTGLNVDRRLRGDEADDEAPTVARSLAETAYWLILLLFLPAILGAFGLNGLLSPVEDMVASIVGFLPQLFAAAVILLVGWFVARIVQRVASGLLAAAGADRLSERVGLASALGDTPFSAVIGTVVYALILVPVIVAALNALALEAVTAPASRMLDTLIGAVPHIFAASLILILSHLVGRVVAGLVANVLAGVGFDRLPARLGLSWSAEGGAAPSAWAGKLVHLAIMLFAVAEASSQLGFAAVSTLTGQFLAFAGHVFMGLAILTIGVLLANLAARAVRAAGTPQSALLASITRGAVLVLTVAMALREMGFADEIVNLAFGLLFGAVAVAAGLAFGLGGREEASTQLRNWRKTVGSGE